MPLELAFFRRSRGVGAGVLRAPSRRNWSWIQFDGRPWTIDVQRVDAAHRAVAASVANVSYVSSDGLRDKGDSLHFDAASARTFGQRYAAAYLAILK